MTKRYGIYLIACLGTLIFFGGGGVILIKYHSGLNPYDIILQGKNIAFQLLLGLLYGLCSSALIIKMMSGERLSGEYEKYKGMIRQLLPENLHFGHILFLSFCAGFGEELFFRAYLQPYWGIWVTSLFFVAIHGYLNPRRPIFIYGLFMTLDIAGVGWMYKNYGFISAASAHMVIDFILIAHMTSAGKSESCEEK